MYQIKSKARTQHALLRDGEIADASHRKEEASNGRSNHLSSRKSAFQVADKWCIDEMSY